MKKNYIAFEMDIVMLEAQDVVTVSGFNGEDHGFGDPNNSTNEVGQF